MENQTLYNKIFNSHIVKEEDDGVCLLYIDRHLVHEVTSPQAFLGLRTTGRKVKHPEKTLAVADHNVPTTRRELGIEGINDEVSKAQVVALQENCAEFGVPYIALTDIRQGVVHIMGSEQGFTLPATTLVCGDSHTATHGAFGALAFGIGTSEVEHVLATGTVIQKRSKNMLIKINGELGVGITAKDLILYIIGKIGTAGGTGFVMEFQGNAIKNLSMEARMTVCNMAIEAGARAGLVAPDEKTFEYLKDKPMSPKGAEWGKAVAYWKTMKSDADAKFDEIVEINTADIAPQVTWGTSPQDVLPITANVPTPETAAQKRSLEYMGLEAGIPLSEIAIDKVFIGSCTNGRIEDLRLAAGVVKGHKVADNIKLAMVVPGSGLVKEQAESEGLDKIFTDAGFEWRAAGCSMCLAMNDDQLSDGERCASTSNRNFEGRQGRGGRTHLVSPAMAGAAAIVGKLTDIRNFN